MAVQNRRCQVCGDIRDTEQLANTWVHMKLEGTPVHRSVWRCNDRKECREAVKDNDDG